MLHPTLNCEAPLRDRVVMVHDYPPFNGGGLALSVLDLAHLLDQIYDVSIISSRAVDHYADDRLPPANPPPSDVSVRSALSALLKTRRADIVISHWTFSFRTLSTWALIFNRTASITVCVIHTAPDHLLHNRLRCFPKLVKRAFIQTFNNYALGSCKAVIALSPSHAAALIAAGIRVTDILPVPVRIGCPTTNPVQPRQPRGTMTIGIAGELSTLKGSTIIPSLLWRLLPRFRLDIVGDGPLRRWVAAHVALLDQERRRLVNLRGHVGTEVMAEFYEGIDFLLILSPGESQCRVALEAMLCGVLVVGRPAVGIVDLVTDGLTGFVVEGSDVDSLVDQIEEISSHDQLIFEQIRDRARRFAEAQAAQNSDGWLAFGRTLRE